jgi:tRNA-splicing ligase RtcB
MTDQARTVAPVRTWLAEPLAPECKRAIERLSRLDDVRHIAVMPDVHAGSDVCTGIALATSNTLIPQAVGADIGCGMSTCRLPIDADAVSNGRTAMEVLAAIRRAVPVIRHNHRSPPTLPAEINAIPLSAEPLRNALKRDGTIEFGTLGRGNHFLELQRDDDNALWLLVHSGSRAMGQVITRHHLAKAAKIGSGVAALDARSEPGAAYATDVSWAITYARLSREAMLHTAARAIGQTLGIEATPSPIWGTTHNNVTRENHDNTDLWVHRKGVAPAHAGLANIIPGSMAAETYHVEGRGEPASLCSSSHGAGRALSRTEATRRTSTKDLNRQLRDVFVDESILPRLRDEAPAAYRDIRAVMRAQSDLVRITRKLHPILTFKGV